MLDSGAVADAAEIADREGIIRNTVTEVLRLALLAPGIVEVAIAGSLPGTMSLEKLLWVTLPRDWNEQQQTTDKLAYPPDVDQVIRRVRSPH